MANPLYNVLNSAQNPMLSQFSSFMRQMQGQNPRDIINNMVSSGKINQQQLNQVQQQAQQMQAVFDGFKGMFGF